MTQTADHRVEIALLKAGHAPACVAIGRSLPAWFGIEEGLDAMATANKDEPGLVAIADGRVVGFVTVTQHFVEAWEIGWMAVEQRWHRRGVGRQLIDATLNDARTQGVRFLQVKTLAPTHPSPEYASTRAFYQAVGFVPLEIFPELWGSANPALQLVLSVPT